MKKDIYPWGEISENIICMLWGQAKYAPLGWFIIHWHEPGYVTYIGNSKSTRVVTYIGNGKYMSCYLYW